MWIDIIDLHITDDIAVAHSTDFPLLPFSSSSNPIPTPQPATSGNTTSSSSKRSAMGGGKENTAPKEQPAAALTPDPDSGEAWPSLNAIATKESKKSKGSKGDRSNSSAKHTDTDEHNNNNKK